MIDEIFYESIETSKLLQTVAAGGAGATGGVTVDYSNMNTTERVFLIGKIRMYCSILKSWKPPKLPEQVDYSYYDSL